MRGIAADARVGRGEAMRQAMLRLAGKGEPWRTGPAFWAPFAVVGEGAAPASR